MKSKFVALMPLRGGSKGIPKKNLVLVKNKPLFYWALKAAVDSTCFDEIWVSTDCAEIAAAVTEHFPQTVHVLSRPPELALDETSTEAVMLHFAEHINFDVLCLVQATSPLLQSHDFQEAKMNFIEGHFDSLLSVCEFKRFLWSREGQPLNYQPQNRPRRQEFEGCLVENGAFYFTKKNILLGEGLRLGGKIGHHTMTDKNFFEIDSALDLSVLESIWDS